MSIFIPSISNSFNKQLIKFIIKNDGKYIQIIFRAIKIKTYSLFSLSKIRKKIEVQKEKMFLLGPSDLEQFQVGQGKKLGLSQ